MHDIVKMAVCEAQGPLDDRLVEDLVNEICLIDGAGLHHQVRTAADLPGYEVGQIC